jgi:hypothetical protein
MSDDATDAARYRWLRDTDHWNKPMLPDFNGTLIRGVKCTNFHQGSVACVDWLNGSQLDEIIDLEMAATTSSGEVK